MQVMLLRNLDLTGRKSDLVNGSRGVVVGWKTKAEKLAELSIEHNRSKKNKDSGESGPMSAYERLKNSSLKFIPIVKFRNERHMDCIPELFEYEVLNVGKCRRLQVSTLP